MDLQASHPAGLQRPLQRRLTKMYSETKRSYDTVTEPPKAEITPEMSSLHRRLRIQKDRLITWGLEWSDTTAAQPGDIDESVEREGFTTVVTNVMSDIKEMLEEAEQMRSADKGGMSADPYALESKQSHKDRWIAADKPRFQDLLTDLTTSIDTLFNLSRSRRRSAPTPTPAAKRSAKGPWSVFAGSDSPAAPAFSKAQSTVATASAYKPQSAASTRVPPSMRIDLSALVLPEEGFREPLPPYETIATPSNSRMIGYLRRPHTSTNPWKKDGSYIPTVPVLIEYAPFDPVYSTTGVLPSMDRLESLAEALHDSDESLTPPDTRVLNLLGYFECPKHPRFGLVYELPDSVYSGPSDFDKPAESLAPFTLFSLLQGSVSGGGSSVPNLEDRLRLAFSLATTFLHLHTKEVVHRDVTSNNIVFFRGPAPTLSSSGQDFGCDLRSPYLASFDLFSEFDVDLEQRTDIRPAHIYRHLLDKRSNSNSPYQSYRPSFDIYGLGMILLEIGLWMPLSSFWKRTYDLPTFQNRILNIYVKKLGHKCGGAYMRAVESCLSAADHEKYLLGQGQTVDVQWRLYCDVVKRLQRSCALDEDDDVAPEEAQTTLPSSLSNSSRDELAQKPEAPGILTPQSVSTSQIDALKLHQSRTPQLATEVPSQGKTAPKPRLKVHPIKISRPQLDEWHRNLLPRLERVLEKTLTDSKETFTIDLIGVGESAQSARPTIFITCTSVGRVKSILSRHFKYDHAEFDLRVRKGKLRRSCAKKSRAQRQHLPRRSAKSSGQHGDQPVMNPYHQERPLCGASIGAYKYDTDSHHAAVSYGGVVMVDGEPFGMTVHHLLDESSDEEESDESDGESPSRSSGARRTSRFPPWLAGQKSNTPHQAFEQHYISDFSDDESDDETEHGTEADFDWPPLDCPGPDEDTAEEPGDASGIRKGQGSQYMITQPALDDLGENFFPSEEDKNDEHLQCHGLGNIYASSGIRRWKRDHEKHEIDWALVKVDSNRLQPFNVIQGGRRYCRPPQSTYRPDLLDPVCRQPSFLARDDLYPNQVASLDDLPGLQVHSIGRTSGLQAGTISQAMSSVRVAGRTTSSRSWHVLGNFGGMHGSNRMT